MRAVYTTVNLFSIWREKVSVFLLFIVANNIYYNLNYWVFDSSVGTCTWLQIKVVATYGCAYKFTQWSASPCHINKYTHFEKKYFFIVYKCANMGANTQ